MFMIGVMMPKAIHSDLPAKMVGITVSAILTGIGKRFYQIFSVELMMITINQLNYIIYIPSFSIIPLGSGGEHLGRTEPRRAAAVH